MPDVLGGALALMPVTQVEWERNIDWGDDGDKAESDARKQKKLDDALTSWKKDINGVCGCVPVSRGRGRVRSGYRGCRCS